MSMKNIEMLVDEILVEVKKTLIEKLTGSDDFLEESLNTEDLLEESDDPHFATADDFEDFEPMDLSNVRGK